MKEHKDSKISTYPKIMDSKKNVSRDESSEDEPDDVVDFTLCEDSLKIKDIRWIDVFGFFLLGLAYRIFSWLKFSIIPIMWRKIGTRTRSLEIDASQSITIQKMYLYQQWPITLAQFISPFFPLWISIRILLLCLLYGIGISRIVMAINLSDLGSAVRVVNFAFGVGESSLMIHTINFHRFVIISWFIGEGLADMIKKILMVADRKYYSELFQEIEKPLTAFLLMPSLIAIIFFFTLTDVDPLVPCRTIWDSMTEWLFACLNSVRKKIRHGHKGWYYMCNMLVNSVLKAAMTEFTTLGRTEDALGRKTEDMIKLCRDLSVLIGYTFSGFFAFVPVYLFNLIALIILVAIYQISNLMANVTLLITLVLLSDFLLGTARPIIFYQLRLDESFDPSETQFFFGILCFLFRLGRMLGAENNMKSQKSRYSNESSEDEPSTSNKLVDFTLCENSLVIKDLRWMDVFGFLLLGFCNSFSSSLTYRIDKKMKLKIGDRNKVLEADNEIILDQDYFLAAYKDGPMAAATFVAPFFPLWMSCLLYGIGTNWIVMAVNFRDLHKAMRLVTLTYSFSRSSFVMHTISFHRFVIISWFVGYNAGHLFLPTTSQFLSQQHKAFFQEDHKPIAVFLLMPTIIAITFFFMLTDVEPIVPCTTIWNTITEWLLACLKSVIKKLRRIYIGWYYMSNMLLAITILGATWELNDMQTPPEYLNRKSFIIDSTKFTVSIFAGFLAFIPLYLFNLLALALLVLSYQLKSDSDPNVVAGLIYISNGILAAFVPVSFLQLRMDERFSPSETQFFFGFNYFLYTIGKYFGVLITKAIPGLGPDLRKY